LARFSARLPTCWNGADGTRVQGNGLAPYAENAREARKLAEEFEQLFEFDPRNSMIWRRKNGSPAMQFAADYLADRIQRKRFDHIGRGGTTVHRTIFWRGGLKTACARQGYAGRPERGVFMNVKANKRILELPEVEELFVFPSCGDETNAIGAAWLRYHQMYKQIPQPLEIYTWARRARRKM